MQVRISDIPSEGLDLQYDSSAAEMGMADTDVEFTAGIRVLLHLARVDKIVSLSGEGTAEARVKCVRCLSGVPCPLHLSFRMDMEPERTELKGHLIEGHELHRGELDEHYYTGDSINITDLLREQILLALPAYPVCGEGCRGLCPKCGLDLNRSSCHCTVETLHPPMNRLQEQIKKIKKKSREAG